MSQTPVTPELAPLVARFYAEAPLALRVRLLNGLLRPVGPLALVVLAAGAFGRLLPSEAGARWHGAAADLGDALRIDASQVLELARYVEQKCPEWLAQLPAMAGESPAWAASVSGVLLLAALRRWQAR